MSPRPQPPEVLADQAARELAVTEFERPVVLEAGAGTGKTRALVARLATWLLGPGWAAAEAELGERRSPGGFPGGGLPPVEPAEIAARAAEGAVAITFTEAAAAEMARRLGELLGAVAAGEPAKDLEPLPQLLAGLDLVGRAQRLAAVLSRLRLQTIHGFCHRLLADHPFEAGLHPNLSVDADASEVAATTTEVLIEALRSRQPQVAALVREAVSPSELHAALLQLIAGGARKEDFARDPFDDATCALLLAKTKSSLRDFLPELDRLATAAKRMKTLPRALDALGQLASLLDEPAEPGRAGLARFADEVRASSDGWQELLARYSAGDLKTTEDSCLGAGRQRYLDLARTAHERLEDLRALDLRRFELARRALGPLVEQIRYRLDRAGVLTFDDLLDRAADLLQRNAGVRRRLRREIRQLLVDEFQDTDRRQCDLLAALALGTDEGHRPGLFIVGDPKQSIYAWRRADLASYESFVATMAEAGGESARLSVNFRSVPAVLAEVERAVAPVMLPEPGVQPRFEPLTPGPALAASAGFERRERRPVEHWLSWDAQAVANGDSTKAAQANAVEAAAIAADIRDLHDAEGLPWESFALLLRARGALETYLEALRRAGIPYAVQKDRSYYRRREIIDLACAVRAILDPADLLALVAFLRSPLVGVPDAAWIPLWRAGFAAAMADLEDPQGVSAVERAVAAALDRLPPAIPGLEGLGDWPLALSEAVRAVAQLRADFRRLPAAGWVERLRAWLLPEPLAAARFLGRFGVANVERLLQHLERELEEESDPHRALARLRQAVEEEKEAEDARPPDAGADAVAVMTIHTAKGLEFDQVYLAQIQRGNRGNVAGGNVSEVLDGVTGHGRELRLLGAPSPGYLAADRHRSRSRDAEAVRLLYVAMTRARQRLVICGNWEEMPPTPDPARAKTFLDLLAGRHPGNLHELEDGSEVIDSFGVAWRFAARRASPGASGKPTGWTRGTAPARTAATHTNETIAATAEMEAIGPTLVSPARRTEARWREARPRLEPAAALASPQETENVAPDAPGETAARSFALARGVALHRALELEELGENDPAGWRTAVEAAFRSELPAADTAELLLLRSDCDRLAFSPLLARLRALRPAVLARELPLLAQSSGTGALDGVVGTLDLLYRDPATGEVVVADFKTDEIAEATVEEAIADKVRRYRPQLELYGRAVESALALDRPPRLELWLLAANRVEALPRGGNAAR